MLLRLLLLPFVLLGMYPAAAQLTPPPGLSAGDLVRVVKADTLQLNGAYFLGAPKGYELTVRRLDRATGALQTPFVKPSGEIVLLTLPAASVEAVPLEGMSALLAAGVAFREQQYEDARRLLGKAGEDRQLAPIATPLIARINAAVSAVQALRDPTRAAASAPAAAAALQVLRGTAEQLVKLNHPSLAVYLDEGADKLCANLPPAVAPLSKIARDELGPKAALAEKSVLRVRQALAFRRALEAQRWLEEGSKADPGRPEWTAFRQRIEKDLLEADERFAAADKMRRHERGVPHALTAIEHGLKACADHPRLVALRKEMESAFEERTAPPLTAAMLKGGSEKDLQDGRRLYTTRCTECHELELLDSRSISAWQTTVAGMARRANLSGPEQQRILAYLAAAQASL